MKSINTSKIINSVTDHAKHFKLLTAIIAIIIFLIFFISVICFAVNGYSYRRTFTFEGLDKNALYVETRYYPHVRKVNKVELYVSELVVGPIGNRYKNLFAPGTKVEECFVRGRNLYVDLSKEALFPDATTSEINRGIELFKKNIYKNFPSIDSIHLFIDGESVNQ